MAKAKSGIYSGRLVADGYGNLLADEGERAGEPVAYHEGSYVFVGKGEPSHNERHHENFAIVDGTTDDNADENPQHYEVQPDDPHYHEGATDAEGNVTNVRLQFSPDKAAATETGHTDAYTGGDE